MDVKAQCPMFTNRSVSSGVPISLAKLGWGGPHITRDIGTGDPISRGSPYRAYTGSVAGLQVALDRINSDPTLVPGYTLHYTHRYTGKTLFSQIMVIKTVNFHQCHGNIFAGLFGLQYELNTVVVESCRV